MNPDVNISQEKYNIKLFVPGQDGLSEHWLRCDNVSQSGPVELLEVLVTGVRMGYVPMLGDMDGPQDKYHHCIANN